MAGPRTDYNQQNPAPPADGLEFWRWSLRRLSRLCAGFYDRGGYPPQFLQDAYRGVESLIVRGELERQ